MDKEAFHYFEILNLSKGLNIDAYFKVVNIYHLFFPSKPRKRFARGL